MGDRRPDRQRRRPTITIERAPATNSSSTIFEFVGDRRPDAARAAHVRVPRRQHERPRLGGVRQPVQPARLLHLRGPADGARPAHLRGARDRQRRAAVRTRTTRTVEGNVDPTPATLHVDDDGRHHAARHRRSPPARRNGSQRGVRESASSSSAPTTRPRSSSWRSSARSTTCRSSRASSPDAIGGARCPARTRFRVRAIDLAGNVDPTPATRTLTVVAGAGHDDHLRPGRPDRRAAARRSPPSTSESAIFVFSADQPGSTFECSLDGAEFAPCTSPHAYWVRRRAAPTSSRCGRPTRRSSSRSRRRSTSGSVELGPDTVPPNTDDPRPARRRSTRSTVATFTFTGSDNRIAPT